MIQEAIDGPLIPEQLPKRERLHTTLREVEFHAVLPGGLPSLHLERDELHSLRARHRWCFRLIFSGREPAEGWLTRDRTGPWHRSVTVEGAVRPVPRRRPSCLVRTCRYKNIPLSLNSTHALRRPGREGA